MKKIKKILSYAVFWLMQCTWGIIMTLIGAIAAVGLILTGHKPKTMGPTIYFEVGENWGGVNFGPFFICNRNAPIHIKYHESGHGLQNLLYGPLFPFIVAIPSITRYWLREMPTRIKKSIFNLFFLVASLAITTIIICFTGPLLHLHWLTIFIESLRVYLALISIWLTLFEIPKYDQDCSVSYDEIWFENQATRWGKKMYEKKED